MPYGRAFRLPQGGGRVIGLIRLMGLIGPLCLLGELFGSPKGGGGNCSLFIVHYSLTNMAHIGR